jgi:hypothetical protein
LDVYHRLVDEFDWAAIRGGYDVAEIERAKNALGYAVDRLKTRANWVLTNRLKRYIMPNV